MTGTEVIALVAALGLLVHRRAVDAAGDEEGDLVPEEARLGLGDPVRDVVADDEGADGGAGLVADGGDRDLEELVLVLLEPDVVAGTAVGEDVASLEQVYLDLVGERADRDAEPAHAA